MCVYFTCQWSRKNSQGLGLLSFLETPSLSAVGVMSKMPGTLLKAQILEALVYIAELKADETHSVGSTFKELRNLLATDGDQ